MKKYKPLHPSAIDSGYGYNTEWIKVPEQLTNAISSDNKSVVLCSIPGELPDKKEEYTNYHLQFLEAVKLMRTCSCTIISACSESQMKEQCNGGYQVLKKAGLLEGNQLINLRNFWYQLDHDGQIIASSRSGKRVVDEIIKIANKSTNTVFLLRLGSVRICDAVARLILESKELCKVYVLDTFSPIDFIRSNALIKWGKEISKYKYFSGNFFVSLSPEEIKKISSAFSIGLICVSEMYNFVEYPSLINTVIRKIEATFPPINRVWISWPGHTGNEYKVADLLSIEFETHTHYTIIIENSIH